MNTVISPMKIVNDLFELSYSTVLIKSNFRNGARFAFSRAILEFFHVKNSFPGTVVRESPESLSRAGENPLCYRFQKCNALIHNPPPSTQGVISFYFLFTTPPLNKKLGKPSTFKQILLVSTVGSVNRTVW